MCSRVPAEGTFCVPGPPDRLEELDARETLDTSLRSVARILARGFTRHSDKVMWDALEAVQMKDYVASLPGALDSHVSEGGGNLSVSRSDSLQ